MCCLWLRSGRTTFPLLRSGRFRLKPVCQLVEMDADGGGGFRVVTQGFAYLGENERIAEVALGDGSVFVRRRGLAMRCCLF